MEQIIYENPHVIMTIFDGFEEDHAFMRTNEMNREQFQQFWHYMKGHSSLKRFLLHDHSFYFVVFAMVGTCVLCILGLLDCIDHSFNIYYIAKLIAYFSHLALEAVVLTGEVRHWRQQIDSARFIIGDLIDSIEEKSERMMDDSNDSLNVVETSDNSLL